LRFQKKKTDEPLILSKEAVSRDQIYSNFATESPRRETVCNEVCLQNIEALPTKMKSYFYLRNYHVIHTEIQMMHRQSKNILTKEENRDKIILVYSKYIPCAQNQGAKGGVFLECAGEMANFVVNKNPRRIRFIVFYEETHSQTISPVAHLYMEMSGIIALKYTHHTKTIQRATRLISEFATHFQKDPKFLRLGRPLLDYQYETTSTQLFVDCIARNNFIVKDADSETERQVQFIAAKCQLYKYFSMDSSKLFPLYQSGFQVHGITTGQKSIIAGCYKYAQKMYGSHRTNAITMKKKTTAFLSFEGSPRSNWKMERVKFYSLTKQKACQAFLPGFIAHFRIPKEKQEVCKF